MFWPADENVKSAGRHIAKSERGKPDIKHAATGLDKGLPNLKPLVWIMPLSAHRRFQINRCFGRILLFGCFNGNVVCQSPFTAPRMIREIIGRLINNAEDNFFAAAEREGGRRKRQAAGIIATAIKLVHKPMII